MDIGKLKLPPNIEEWAPFDEQRIRRASLVYDVSELVEQARDLKPFKLPLRGINLDYSSLTVRDTLSNFICHVKAVFDSSLEYPIILAPDGFIMDGRHRLCKAMLLGKKTIDAVQFTEWPEPSEIVDDAD